MIFVCILSILLYIPLWLTILLLSQHEKDKKENEKN